MRGKPKFKLGDKVRFKVSDNDYKEGIIEIIDAYGTFEDSSDVSYDILVENDKHKVTIGYNTDNARVKERIGPCLYKHIREDFVENGK